MSDHPIHVLAAAKWIELGVASTRNPVHRWALKAFYEPLGISCEYMVFDPVTSIRPDTTCPTLVNPTWSIDRVDPDWRSSFPDTVIRRLITTTVDEGGVFTFKIRNEATREELPLMDAFDSGTAILTVSAKARNASIRYIYRAFAEACLPEAKPERSALLINNPEQYAETILG